MSRMFLHLRGIVFIPDQDSSPSQAMAVSTILNAANAGEADRNGTYTDLSFCAHRYRVPPIDSRGTVSSACMSRSVISGDLEHIVGSRGQSRRLSLADRMYPPYDSKREVGP
jgi:hypothetical protein